MRRTTGKNDAALGCLVLTLLAAPSVVWSGYVLSILWEWFVVPTFGLPALTLPAAIGLSTVVGYLTHQAREIPSDSDRSMWGAIADAAGRAFGAPAFALLFGYIVSRFMVAT